MPQARAANPWPAAGSQTAWQQALRDLDQAWRNFFGATHDRPTWRKRGRHEGFRIVGAQALRVRQMDRRWSSASVPKVDWVKVRRSRDLPDQKSYRVTRDRKGSNRRGTLAAPGRDVRQKAGLNRGILAACWSALVTRLEQKAPGRVEKVDPAYTSRTCNACEHVAREPRESQAVFRCVACGHRDNADVNAARTIRDREPTAVGRTVAARGDRVQSARSVKREPQRARPPKVA